MKTIQGFNGIKIHGLCVTNFREIDHVMLITYCIMHYKIESFHITRSLIGWNSMLYKSLYNNPSCSCILIGSHPWSIRGQMYNWCYHYRPQASDPLYIYCIHFTLQPSFFRIVNVSWHGYLKTKLKNKKNKEHFGRHQKHLNHHSITEGSLVEIIASQITYRIKSTITLKVKNIKCKLKHV